MVCRYSVVSDSLRPHGLQYAKPPCPSPTPGVDSDSRPSSRWCHPAISSSVIPFSSCLQSFPTSGNQSTGASASASVLHWIVRVDFLEDGLVWSDSSCVSRLKFLFNFNSTVLGYFGASKTILPGFEQRNRSLEKKAVCFTASGCQELTGTWELKLWSCFPLSWN